MLKSFLSWLRAQYVCNQVQDTALPDFPQDRICRYRITFFGRVQNVGFRMEAAQLSARLGLTGFCENLPDGSVLGEFQGPENRIFFLISFLESLKRIIIAEKIIEELPVDPKSRGFQYR